MQAYVDRLAAMSSLESLRMPTLPFILALRSGHCHPLWRTWLALNLQSNVLLGLESDIHRYSAYRNGTLHFYSYSIQSGAAPALPRYIV
jgi:hypothetical protein